MSPIRPFAARRAALAVLLTAAGCGLHIGSPARRAFPNHPSAASFDSVPLSSKPGYEPVRCRIALDGAVQEVEFAAPIPAGLSLSAGAAKSALVPPEAWNDRLRAIARGAMASCPRAAARTAGGEAGVGRTFRIIVERIELNRFHDTSPAVDVARVLARMEAWDAGFSRFESWRAEGRARVTAGALKPEELVDQAGRDAFAGLLDPGLPAPAGQGG